MPMPSSGAISLNDANIELGIASGTTISLNQASVRTLFGIGSGAIGMGNGYGKSNRVTANITISADTANYTLNTAKVTGYSAGKTDVTLTINSGVTVFSNSTGSYAMSVDTSWAAGDTVTIVNNGVILGRGGTGTSATAGGPALLVQRATSINNVNRIAGGGGGGGGGGSSAYSPIYKTTARGGGGGGGIGNGPGGAPPNNGTAGAESIPAGSGGSGTLTAPGGGGGGGGIYMPGGKSGYFSYGGSGGAGGTYGSAGVGGGAGGGAVVGNGNITWIATGTRNGSIS